MLNLSMREGDYFLIGDNIKVYFKQKAGKDHIHVGIEAPRELRISRCLVHEKEVAEKAASGDTEAAEINAELERQAAERIAKYNKRKASRDYFDRNIRAGKMQKPEGWEDIPDTKRYV